MHSSDAFVSHLSMHPSFRKLWKRALWQNVDVGCRIYHNSRHGAHIYPRDLH
jgi:hypothetical protein